jgi:hypothetical protein
VDTIVAWVFAGALTVSPPPTHDGFELRSPSVAVGDGLSDTRPFVPFTPYHFGPGLLLKGIAPAHSSMVALCAANVVVDCETLYHLVRRDPAIHGVLHTFLGATLAGVATALVMVATRRWWDRGFVRRLWVEIEGQALAQGRSAFAIAVGAVVGGASHPLFDELMHPDVHPFAPWTDDNPLLGHLTGDGVRLLCVACAIVGGVVLTWRRQRTR